MQHCFPKIKVKSPSSTKYSKRQRFASYLSASSKISCLYNCKATAVECINRPLSEPNHIALFFAWNRFVHILLIAKVSHLTVAACSGASQAWNNSFPPSRCCCCINRAFGGGGGFCCHNIQRYLHTCLLFRRLPLEDVTLEFGTRCRRRRSETSMEEECWTTPSRCPRGGGSIHLIEWVHVSVRMRLRSRFE
jgi:hypothetical protein